MHWKRVEYFDTQMIPRAGAVGGSESTADQVTAAPAAVWKKALRWSVILAAVGLAAVGATLLDTRKADPAPVAVEAHTAAGAPADAIGCFGRIEPEDGVIQVSAPYSGSRPPLVAELRVNEGDAVQAGQVVAPVGTSALQLGQVDAIVMVLPR